MAVRSEDEGDEFTRRHLAENDLVIAIWFVSDGEFEWLPVKGAELLDDPSLIGSENEIKLAGIPCEDEDEAKSLRRRVRMPGALEVKH
jgi:hypothetical protein